MSLRVKPRSAAVAGRIHPQGGAWLARLRGLCPLLYHPRNHSPGSDQAAPGNAQPRYHVQQRYDASPAMTVTATTVTAPSVSALNPLILQLLLEGESSLGRVWPQGQASGADAPLDPKSLVLLSQKVAVLRSFALTSDLIACRSVIEESSGNGHLDSRE
jgi:hypothetical protein